MSLILENGSFCVLLILVLSLIVLLTHENNGGSGSEGADVLPIMWILKQTNVDWIICTTEMPILYFFNVFFLLE